MFDKVENIGRSLIQHGKYNDRIYLMKIHPGDIDAVAYRMDELLGKYSYSKVFAKVPEDCIGWFTNNSFIKEAEVPGFFKGEINALFMCKYFSVKRQTLKNEVRDKTDEILTVSRKRKLLSGKHSSSKDLSIKQLNGSHVYELSKLYKKVFQSYPFPIFDPEYLLETMRKNVVYFGAFFENKLVAASSAEIDIEEENAELTDFATDNDFRGNGIALDLLKKMEHKMEAMNIKTYYTIARALSYGMNITFAKMGYLYSGTLINNTNICGNIESMNVWHKSNSGDNNFIV